MADDLRKNYIGGEWRGADSVRENINPSDTSDIVGVYAAASVKDTEDAIAAAKAAGPGWARSNPMTRHDLLNKIGQELMDRSEELGELLAREEGKTKAEGIGEAFRAGQIFQFFGGEALRLTGEKVDSIRDGVEIEIFREPVGVIGIITPWNFPQAIPAWKIGPALCYGNTVVFKPADLVPGSAWALADIIVRAGVPEGVFNLVMGRGSIVGETMLNSPDVNAISFTGSVSTGQHVVAKCGETLKKVQVELGGKNPYVVLDDADMDKTVANVVNGAFYSTGQRCTASSRLIVQDGIHDKFVDAVVDSIKNMKVGNALEDGIQMGPAVDEGQLNQDLEYIEIGKDEGANLAWGGERLNRDTEGFYIQPALFTETSNDMRVNREEIFGPVASVIRVKDYEEALATANDTTFGLSSGIATNSLKHASHFKHNSAAGMVMINLPTAGTDYHVPFGGRKASSYGAREQGRYAVEFYTAVKTSYIAP